MTTLEEKLREAVKRGLTHLSLYPVPSVDQKTTYWTATAAPSTQHHYVRSTQLDAVDALHQALDELPKAKLRVKKTPQTNGNLNLKGETRCSR